MTLATAPGKAVLSGEYAVLTGAPALVAAVGRRVRVSASASADGLLHLRADGFAAAPVAAPVERLLTHPAWGATARLLHGLGERRGLRLHLDSRALFEGTTKLGLGSSAAIAVASAAALQRRLPDLATLVALHNQAQHSSGSGVDVAASLHGGTTCYQGGAHPVARPAPLAPGLLVRFTWPGAAASTPGLVARFRAWQASAADAPQVLADLQGAAQRVADALATDAGAGYSAMAEWAAHLGEFTRRVGIPWLGGGHAAINAAVADLPVVAKPCGAGAGDIGLLLATDPDALDLACTRLHSAGATILDLEIDPHGVQVTH